MSSSGKTVSASHLNDAVTVAPGHVAATVSLTSNQANPGRVAIAELTAAEAREVAAELIAQAEALEASTPPVPPHAHDAPAIDLVNVEAEHAEHA